MSYSRHQLPVGKNYNEVFNALTMPSSGQKLGYVSLFEKPVITAHLVFYQ